jgi:hypothetical protein
LCIGTTNEAEKIAQMKVLQALLNRLDASRKVPPTIL